jgi:electron transport complex protein RnfD
MRFEGVSSPYLIARTSVAQVMRQVLYALVPGTAALAWYFGWGVLVNIALAVAVALAAEAGMLRLRARPLGPYLGDYSAAITAWLLALALPPLAPWWLTVVGVGFAIVVAKHLYGGLGYNPFNPAMVGYVVLLISFPAPMTQWLPPHMLSETRLGLWDTLVLIFSGQLPEHLSWDALTMATPLNTMRTQLGLNQTIEEIRTSPLWGDFGGRGWEWVGNWFLLGGLWLLYRRVISWQIPVGMLGGLITLAALFFLVDPDVHPFPAFHVFSGGAILGAFFVATDPVTASTTPTGRLVYGAGIGVLTYVIRSWGGYPDGVAFSVLLMNMAAPTIDHYTRPRTFGHRLDRH